MTAAFSQGRLQGYEAGCAARGALGCPSEQGPCTPGGCVLGRDSAACQGQHSACPGSFPQRCGEKLWVEGETPIRAGSFCCQEGAAWLRAAHSCTSPPGHWQRQLFKKHIKARGYLEGKVLSRVCAFSFLLWLGGNSNVAVRFGQEKETPTTFH